ncbi:MAG TPA: hypothetical protein VH988_20415 [Thermoanaerobaculia bacterium]|nr:hypothetical protein [Thermoanaerobaculia bacterium]
MTSPHQIAEDRSTADISRRTDPLSGGGEMGALMRSIDWSTTAVGPVAAWPQSLRTALSILLDTGFPMYIAWGSEFTQFYNDGYRPILGSTKHPAAMGRSTRQTFAEIWHIIVPMFHGVLEGRTTTVVDFLLPLDRHGFVEECYFIFSYSPIREEGGTVGGVLVTVTETTERILGARRLGTLQALAARTQEAATVEAACEAAAAVLAENPADLPFALLYLLSPGGTGAKLAGAAGLDPALRVSGFPACSTFSTSLSRPARCSSLTSGGSWLCRSSSRGRRGRPACSSPGSARASCSTRSTGASSSWRPARSPAPCRGRARCRKPRRAPRRWPRSTGPRRRSSATSAMSSGRR